MLTILPDFNHSAGIFHTRHLHQEIFFPPCMFLSLLIINYCYYSILYKLLALPLFKNTGDVLVPVCLEELSRDGVQQRTNLPIALFLNTHPRLGAQSYLYFEGKTGTIKMWPDAKQLETKAQLESRKGSVKGKQSLFGKD